MKKFILYLAILLLSKHLHSQLPYNSAMPNGYTKRALVAEQIGLTQVSITYHRPAVNGREGKIWGQVVHTGFADPGFGNRKPAPWRAGANENTVIEFEHDVKVEGTTLPKGKYGLFIAYDPSESIIIFSKKSDAWGAFFYDDKDDALRVKARPKILETSVERLKYEFSDQTQNSAVVMLSWEKRSIGFKVEVDYLKQQFEAFVTESQNPRGFTSQGLIMAANWCLQNNYQLEKALEWSALAAGDSFPGDPNSFTALSTKAAILYRLQRADEAFGVTRSALPLGNVVQLQQLGRQLIISGNQVMALEVFEFNYNKNPSHVLALTGMVRGLSANGQYSKALEFANKALNLAVDDPTRQSLSAMIEKLKMNKDVN